MVEDKIPKTVSNYTRFVNSILLLIIIMQFFQYCILLSLDVNQNILFEVDKGKVDVGTFILKLYHLETTLSTMDSYTSFRYHG